MSRYRDSPYQFFCPHCGRRWDATGMGTHRRASFSDGKHKIGANTGFVAAASDFHTNSCRQATPAERRKANKTAEKRWANSPPRASRIWNDPNHPGLRD